MNPEQTKAIIDESEAILFDSSINTHPPEWATTPTYLGVSTLVKKPCAEYAQRIATQSLDPGRREDNFWGFLGNTLCTEALRHLTPHREIQTRIRIGDRERVGHADGITFRGSDGFATAPHKAEFATVEEGKAYATCADDDAVDLAIRQGGLYAADILTQVEQGNKRFPVAAFNRDPSATSVVWPDGLPIAAVIVHVFPRFGPSSITSTMRPVKVNMLTPADIAQVRSFYDRKFEAIACAFDGNTGPAEEFDFSSDGLLEFSRPAFAPTPILSDEATLAKAAAFAESRAFASKAAKAKTDNEPFLKAALASHGVRSKDGKTASVRVGTLLVSGRLPAFSHISIDEGEE